MTLHARDWQPFVTDLEDGRRHLDLAVDGVHCAGCMAKIERGLKDLPGISRARLNLTSKRLAVDWDPATTDPSRIIGRLADLGYTAHPFDPADRDAAEDAETRKLLRCMAVAGFAAMNIMLLSVSVWSGNVTDITPETRTFFHWLSALIALPAAVYAGRPFFESAARALRARSLNMDVPIAIGITLALALSVYQTFIGGEEAYFDSAIMLMFFLLVGRYLDRNMRRRTRSQAENIAALRGESAARIEADGTITAVPISMVRPGDLVLVRPGERVTVDGIVERGSGAIDKSLITGETLPEEVAPGASVYAGTLNVSAALTIRASAEADDTLLSDINRLLEAAAQAKSTYLHLADRAARLYAPLVHGAAALTFAGWMLAGLHWEAALVTAISVLIITCPCALGLAIPAVQVVASGRLFKAGILLNGGDVIERLAEADIVVFDKTGTLTLPEPDLVASDGFLDADRALVADLAAASHHPLAQALARALGGGRALETAAEQSGKGVEAMIDGLTIRLGSPQFCNIDPGRLHRFADRNPQASIVACRIGTREPALFALRQALRPDAAETVAGLRRLGLDVEILSGDRPAAVAPIAEALGIPKWQCEMTPADKIAHLQRLADRGHKVLMVGDGLNDAPALAAAHVSLSPITAVHLSQAAADAVFLSTSLQPVGEAVVTARRARRAMMQNLGLAALYNVIAVPFAVAGFVTPLVAAIAMSGSSIVVTANALRLRLGKAGPFAPDRAKIVREQVVPAE